MFLVAYMYGVHPFTTCRFPLVLMCEMTPGETERPPKYLLIPVHIKENSTRRHPLPCMVSSRIENAWEPSCLLMWTMLYDACAMSSGSRYGIKESSPKGMV